MSIDLIGNGNLPCVYTKNINIDETTGVIATLKVDCSIYDFVNANGDLMWTENTEFLSNDIYVYSIVLYDIKEIANMQDILLNNSQSFPISKILLRHVVNDDLGAAANTNPLAPLINIFTTSFDTTEPIDTPLSFLPPPSPPINKTIEYGVSFTHPCNLSGDVHVVSFIAYDIESGPGANIITPDNKFFIGPILVDTVKLSSSPGNSNYVLTSETFYKDGAIYKGSFHVMQDGKRMSGVVHDNNSVLLGVENNGHNPKLTILRDYDNIYQKQNINYNSLTNANDVVSKPLVSIDDNIVTFLFKVDPFDIFSNNSLLAQYNYLKVVDNLSVEMFINNVESDGTTYYSEVVDASTPLPKLQESTPLRHIKINHSPNSPEMFFEISGIIPPTYTNPQRFQLKIRFNFEQLLGSEMLDLFFLESINSITGNFLKNTDQASYKSFIKNFLIALSLRYEMTADQISTEASILLSSLKGNHSLIYKQKLVLFFMEIYGDLANQFSSVNSNTYTSVLAINTEHPKSLNNFTNGKAPAYFPAYGVRSPFDFTFIYQTPVGFGNFININNLEKRLQEENMRIFDDNPVILEGFQQLMPWNIIGKGLGSGVFNILQTNFTDKLDYYATNEYPELIYLDQPLSAEVELVEGVESEVVFETQEQQQQVQFENQFLDINVRTYVQPTQTYTFYSYN